MRYVYTGGAGTPLHGQRCEPVRDVRGKIVWGRVSALVQFADGSIWIVTRQRLRLAEQVAA